MKEKELSILVKGFLTLQEARGKLYWVRNNSFEGYLSRGKSNYKSYVKQGKIGSPDFIVLIKDGGWVGLELKGNKGKLSEEQFKAKQEIERLGGQYVVVKDLIDITFLSLK
jgi:hypothetical protein